MQENIETAFTLDKTLEANPHSSEYSHRLHFSPSGLIEMFDLAGQSVFSIVKGRFSAQPIDQHSILVHFYDLVELDLYKKYESIIRELEAYEVKVIREEGLFAFRDPWEPAETDENERPCLLYWVRYFFAVDPLARFTANRRGSAYHSVMVEPDTRYYYCQDDIDNDTFTIADLADLGISLQPQPYIKAEYRNKIVLGYRREEKGL